MPLNFDVNDTCPRCGSTIRLAVIYLHPTDRDAAIHSLKCADCGYEKTKLLSLRAHSGEGDHAVRRVVTT